MKGMILENGNVLCEAEILHTTPPREEYQRIEAMGGMSQNILVGVTPGEISFSAPGLQFNPHENKDYEIEIKGETQRIYIENKRISNGKITFNAKLGG